MRQLYLLAVFLLPTWGAFAQESRTYVFSITADEVAQLYRSGPTADPDFLLDRMPVDTLGTNDPFGAGRSPGHYLLLQARAETLHWMLRTVSSHEVYVRTIGRELAVSVLDTVGRARRPTAVRLDGEPLRWHPADTTYRIETYRGDWLRVELPGDTLFFTITEQYDRSRLSRRLERWGQTRTLRLLTTPYRWLRNSVRYVRNGFRYGQWRPRYWPGERLYQRWFGYDRPDFRGYIATNQPTYRPGDTLRLVAYATKYRGRPLRRKLRLSIRHHGEEWVDTLLRPVAPGRYVHTTVVGDSVRLDQEYYVGLEATGGWDPRRLAARIRVEDYELDEYRLAVAAPATFDHQDAVAIDVTAGDVNGLPVVGSEIEILLFSEAIQAAFAERFTLPDTLWRQRFATDDRTELTILVPDSLLPAARLALLAEVRYTGPSGQQLSEQHRFAVTREPGAPRIELRNDSLLLSATSTVPDSTATLELYYPDLPVGRRRVMLPLRLPIHPAVHRYGLLYNGKRSYLNLQREPSGVEVRGNWQRDTLFLAVDNPRRLRIDWQLRDPAGRFFTGWTDRAIAYDTILIELDRTQLWLSWSHRWAGQETTEEQPLYNGANRLAVNLELPARAYPGQTVPVAIAVADPAGRPRAGVPVAMGAYNARFAEAPYTTPPLRQATKRAPLEWQQFGARSYALSRRDSLRRRWVEPLQLHDSAFYRMLLPGPALYREYRPLSRKQMPDSTLAQVVPFLVRRGARQPVHLIYLDNRLLYFAPSMGSTPYALVARPGYHQLTLRTDRAEYRLDSVLLRAGQQLVLSLDTERAAAVPNPRIVRTEPRLTREEQARLSRQLLVLRSLPYTTPGPHFVWQDSTRVFAIDRPRRDQWWGLFTENKESLRAYTPGRAAVDFRFEAGFSYALSPERDRLYATDLALPLKDIRLDRSAAQPAFGQVAWFPATLPRIERDSIWSLRPEPALPDRRSGTARLALGELPADLHRVVLLQNDSLVRITGPIGRIGQLPPGDYRIWLLYGGRTGHSFPLFLPANEMQYYAIDTLVLPRLSLPNRLQTQLEARERLASYPTSSASRVIRRNVPGAFTLSGYVRDVNGEPLIGASVWVEGTTIGTVTDLDGAYQLNVQDPDVRLIVSYTGFVTQVIKAGFGEELEISLAEGWAMLDEVVVTGYGTQRQRDQTTSMVIRGASSVPRELQGRTAGIVVGGGRTTGTASGEGVALASPELVPYTGPRTGFRDYAVWRPLLLTGRDGRVTFDITLPDDITAWTGFALATDRHRAGLGLARTEVYLPLQAQLYLPRFLVAGDRSEAIALAVNRTGAPVRVTPFFGRGDAASARAVIELDRGEELRFPIEAPAGRTDSLDYVFELRGAGFGDGERRALPVYPRGTVTTGGWFRTVDSASAQIDFPFDPRGEPVAVTVYGNNLGQLERELSYLRDYPYLCHEQTASRLIALLAYAKIQGTRGSVEKRVKEDIDRMLQRLARGQNPDGGWGWWPGGGSSPWLSMHAERAFRVARQMAWPGVPDSTGTYRYLVAELPALNGAARLATLLFLAEARQNLEYAALLPPVDTLHPPGLHERLLRARIRQLAGLEHTLAFLDTTRRATQSGALYWGETGQCGYAPHRRTLANNLLAYQLLRTAARPDLARRARRYLLEGRFSPQHGTQPRLGQNTYESALLIHALLPELLHEDEELQPVSGALLTVDRTVALNELPARVRLTPAEAATVRIRKAGSGPLFLVAAQQRFEIDPPVRDTAFRLQTLLWQEERPVTQLRAGMPATLEVRVTVRAESDYVLIEVPIPAGCSYGEKIFGEGRYESHREYRRDRVAIFCTRLPVGEHTFRVFLEPRFSGVYQLNPARAEMMYLPMFNGNNQVKEVAIE